MAPQFVWAQMPKFSPWPAKICDNVPENVKKYQKCDKHICVYFFGTHN